MAKRSDFQDWVLNAVKACGGRATVVEVAKHIWANHEAEISQSGNLLYTWQYDMRWAATILRKKKILQSAEVSPRGIWEIR